MPDNSRRLLPQISRGRLNIRLVAHFRVHLAAWPILPDRHDDSEADREAFKPSSPKPDANLLPSPIGLAHGPADILDHRLGR